MLVSVTFRCPVNRRRLATLRHRRLRGEAVQPRSRWEPSGVRLVCVRSWVTFTVLLHTHAEIHAALFVLRFPW